MPFKTIPGIVGKVYVPDKKPDVPKKHDCPDCYFCQQCSDDKCQLCRSQDARGCRKEAVPATLHNVGDDE